MGEVFVSVKKETVESMIELDTQKRNEDIEALEKEAEEIRNTLKALKAELYTKFGNAINLEKS